MDARGDFNYTVEEFVCQFDDVGLGFAQDYRHFLLSGIKNEKVRTGVLTGFNPFRTTNKAKTLDEVFVSFCVSRLLNEDGEQE